MSQRFLTLVSNSGIFSQKENAKIVRERFMEEYQKYDTKVSEADPLIEESSPFFSCQSRTQIKKRSQRYKIYKQIHPISNIG